VTRKKLRANSLLGLQTTIVEVQLFFFPFPDIDILRIVLQIRYQVLWFFLLKIELSL